MEADNVRRSNEPSGDTILPEHGQAANPQPSVPKAQGLVPDIDSVGNYGAAKSTERQANGEAAPNRKNQKRISPDMLMVILTTIIAAITGLNVWIFYLESEDTTKHMDQLKDKVGEIVGSINTTLFDNRIALAQAFEVNRKALESSERQSKAALDASIKATQLDERAWVTVSKHVLSSELEEGKPIFVQYFFLNSGKTPAIDEISQSRLALSNDEPKMPTFTDGLSHLQRNVVPPTLAEAAAAQTGESARTEEWIPPLSNIKSYVANTQRLFLQVKVMYKDTFGIGHWTTMCAYHIHGRPLDEFSYCVNGNEMDRNK